MRSFEKFFFFFTTSVLLASALILLPFIKTVSAEPAPDPDITKTLEALLCGSSFEKWASTLTAGDEWYVLAAHAYDDSVSFDAYAKDVLEYAANTGIVNPVERQRYALALTAAGRGGDPFVTSTPGLTVSNESGVMSAIFGLHLANNGVIGQASADDIIHMLMDMRTSDGGWTVRGTSADVDVTAMAVTALSLYYESLSDVADAVDTALALLSEKQTDRGGFSSYGVENAESSAQVVIALTSLGRDPASDPEFIRNGHSVTDALASYRLPDGTYCHTVGGSTNATATVQALSALIAQKRLHDGRTPFYIFGTHSSPPDDTDRSDIPVDTKEDVVTGSAPASTPDGAPLSPKVIAVAVVAAVAAVAVIVLIVRRNRDIRNYIIVIILAALSAVIVFSIDIKTPDAYFSDTAGDTSFIGYVSVSFDCSSVACMADHIPSDGVLLAAADFGISPGDTVRDITVAAAKHAGLLLDFDASWTYLYGINGIREHDFGDLSGWTYRVNGETPSVGCSEYKVTPGDRIEWIYVTEFIDIKY